MKKQVLFQAECKAKGKINICQNQLQMRLLLIPECHKNLEGLKGNKKKILMHLGICFVNLNTFPCSSAVYFQIAACEVAQCYKKRYSFQLIHCQA